MSVGQRGLWRQWWGLLRPMTYQVATSEEVATSSEVGRSWGLRSWGRSWRPQVLRPMIYQVATSEEGRCTQNHVLKGEKTNVFQKICRAIWFYLFYIYRNPAWKAGWLMLSVYTHVHTHTYLYIYRCIKTISDIWDRLSADVSALFSLDFCWNDNEVGETPWCPEYQRFLSTQALPVSLNKASVINNE